jgi:hypothetical protein
MLRAGARVPPLGGFASGFSRWALDFSLCPEFIPNAIDGCLCVNSFFSSVCHVTSVRKYHTFHSKLVLYNNIFDKLTVSW